MRDRSGARDLIAYGNLYRILGRMEKAGLLDSRWEDPMEAARWHRPRTAPLSSDGRQQGQPRERILAQGLGHERGVNACVLGDANALEHLGAVRLPCHSKPMLSL